MNRIQPSQLLTAPGVIAIGWAAGSWAYAAGFGALGLFLLLIIIGPLVGGLLFRQGRLLHALLFNLSVACSLLWSAARFYSDRGMDGFGVSTIAIILTLAIVASTVSIAAGWFRDDLITRHDNTANR